LVVDSMRAARERLERDGFISAAEKTTSPKRLRDLREDLGTLAIPASERRGFAVDTAGAAEEGRGDGRFLMFSTDGTLGAEQMFRIYRQKDEIEKAFQTIEGDLSLGPVRHRRRDRTDGYTTAIYLAYLLWSRAQERIQRKFPGLTVSKALSLVEDVHLVRVQAGKTTSEWTTRCSAEQAELLKLVGASRFL